MYAHTFIYMTPIHKFTSGQALVRKNKSSTVRKIRSQIVTERDRERERDKGIGRRTDRSRAKIRVLWVKYIQQIIVKGQTSTTMTLALITTQYFCPSTYSRPVHAVGRH